MRTILWCVAKSEEEKTTRDDDDFTQVKWVWCAFQSEYTSWSPVVPVLPSLATISLEAVTCVHTAQLRLWHHQKWRFLHFTEPSDVFNKILFGSEVKSCLWKQGDYALKLSSLNWYSTDYPSIHHMTTQVHWFQRSSPKPGCLPNHSSPASPRLSTLSPSPAGPTWPRPLTQVFHLKCQVTPRYIIWNGF